LIFLIFSTFENVKKYFEKFLNLKLFRHCKDISLQRAHYFEFYTEFQLLFLIILCKNMEFFKLFSFQNFHKFIVLSLSFIKSSIGFCAINEISIISLQISEIGVCLKFQKHFFKISKTFFQNF